MPNKTIVILGPTCTGKTSLAVKLSKLFNGAIISADSRQVVRLMDIGTGKIPAGEINRRVERREDKWIVDEVDIFGYDLVNPDDYFSAYDFVKYYQKTIPRIQGDEAKKSLDGRNIFLVGGTGFYIDAVTGKTSLAEISPNMELRKSLENLSTEELADKLRRLDESAYKTIDTKNPARLVRAIEKIIQVGGVIASDRRERGDLDEIASPPTADLVPPNDIVTIVGLTADREVLYSQSDKWVDGVFTEKLFEEIKLIQARFPESHRLNGLIYGSAVDYLAGKTPLEEAKQQAKFAMHAYIRRQQTWFKRNPQIKWFNILHPNFDADITSIVESELHG